ncbi:MAG: hypothetical protein Q9M89_02890 [Persephonella sp.]|nr:hypothetical protein [Persephonella sp.]
MGIKKVGLNRNVQPQTLTEKIFFLDFMKGLKTTIKHLFKKVITVDFPFELVEPAPRFRGVHGLRNVDGTEKEDFDAWVKKLKIKPPEMGETRCIACKFCQAACPVPEIFIIKADKLDVPEDHPHHGLKILSQFDMDLSKCMFLWTVHTCLVQLSVSYIQMFTTFHLTQEEGGFSTRKLYLK